MDNLLLTGVVAVVVAGAAMLVAILSARQRNVDYRIQRVAALGDAQFVRSLSGLVRMKFSASNRIALLKNGEEAFPAMFAAVRGAQSSITFENYVYWSGRIGYEFANLLADKARQGIGVHVIVDWAGSLTMDRESLRLMKQSGVEVHFYHRPRFGGLHRLNHRTHRRELVVDGRVGFTGGIGFADQWSGDCAKHCRRDNHYRIEGPLVGDMQAVFMKTG
ncbi:MAG: hypothetical protein DWQ37_11290 [Planctomycetota bacterium]|nr:MAG: hypothetical protein DWQ37_11290 [Planctomycetota bacterium]